MNRYGEEILARYEEVAESLYGQQILRNEIIKTSTSGSKVILALTIPHIVKYVEVVYIFYFLSSFSRR